jgi:hypothetical protein
LLAFGGAFTGVSSGSAEAIGMDGSSFAGSDTTSATPPSIFIEILPIFCFYLLIRLSLN